MTRRHFDEELYHEALTAATRRHFASMVSELEAEGERLETAADEDFYWSMAEEAAERELDTADADDDRYYVNELFAAA